jgi:hypothetical protein
VGTFSQTTLLAGLIVTLAAASLFVEYAPPALSFALAAMAALGWCAWLDRHPSA